MPHVYFDPNTIDWSGFFQHPPQAGNGYFQGVPYQHGGAFGIGALWRAASRYALPVLKAIGREGLSVGGRILEDLSKGEDPVHSATTHGAKGLSNLMSRASDHLQKGSGRRRKRKRPTKKRKRSVKKRRHTGKRRALFAIPPQAGGSTQVHTYRFDNLVRGRFF